MHPAAKRTEHMDKKEQARLEAAGWSRGDYADFLGMTRADLDRELSVGEKARIDGRVTPLAVALAQVRRDAKRQTLDDAAGKEG